jgi:hypothetical protein
MTSDPSARRTLLDQSGEAPVEAGGSVSVLDMHCRIARRMLREGSAGQAFQELVRASRAVPMSLKLAANLSLLAVHARAFAPALTLLSQGLDETEGDERLGVMRQLARLARRSGDLDRSREVLALLLAERPDDRRARAVLNALLEREERWDDLDASLEREVKVALKRRAFLAASRLALRRARLWDSRVEDAARAALRYGQAAQYAEQGTDLEGAFLLRLLWLRSLHRADAPTRALDDAVRLTLAASEQVGQQARARALVAELGLGAARTSGTPSAETETGLPLTSVPPRRHSTQLELVAVAEAAEKAGRSHQAAAVLFAALREGPDPIAARKLEAMHIKRGAWRELATLYHQLVARTPRGPERATWAEKLAELLESELDDPRGAAAAWATVVASTGDSRAVSEQVRLLALGRDRVGVRAALDAGVRQAEPGAQQAHALVLRAEEALTRREVVAARSDLEAALVAVPGHPAAAAGLAELAALTSESGPVRAFEQVLAALPRYTRGRGDLYRRLARLAESPLDDLSLARVAWAEVLVELPGDVEATARSLAHSRAQADDRALEQQLRALIGAELRGPASRAARLELVGLLDRQERAAEALAELKDAVKVEPGHRQAWLAYADRLIALGGHDAEAAWSLEHAATATESPAERAQLWQRLARFAHERLHDEERAAGCFERAERVLAELVVAPANKPGALLFASPPAAQVAIADATVVAPREGAVPIDFEGRSASPVVLPGGERSSPTEPPAPTRGPGSARDGAASRPAQGPLGPVEQPGREPAADETPADSSERLPSTEGVLPGGERSSPTEPPAPTRGPSSARDGAASRPAHRQPVPVEQPDREPAADETPADSSQRLPPTEGALPGGPLVIPPRRVPDSGGHVPLAAEPEARLEPAPLLADPLTLTAGADLDGPAPSEVPSDVHQVLSAEVELPSEETGVPPAPEDARASDVREAYRTQELPLNVGLGDPQLSLPPSFGPSPSKALGIKRAALLERVRARPLDADGYRLLAEHFDLANDPARSSLMLELARALEGDPNAAPHPPRLILDVADRAGLRHPSLRGEEGELMGLVGLALCSLYPRQGREAGLEEEFHLGAGRGARASADALLAAVRILGLRAPDVYLSQANGPPFALVYAAGPRLLVGRLAVKRELADAELRFFAGRALFTQLPELMALRNLRRDQLVRGLELVSEVARGRVKSTEAQLVLREAIAPRSWERVRELTSAVAPYLDIARLTDGARSAANRAGLVVCGGVAPAISALRAKKALPTEMIELVRFAASERYLQLRGRVLARRS